MRDIPKKNYFILFLVLIVTVALTFYARAWYNTTKEYYARNSVIKETVREINENEIYSYTLESPKFILYASSGTNVDIKNFESNLRKLIIKSEMVDDFVYLNLDNVDINGFNAGLKSKFSSRVNNFSDDSISTFYVFKDGKIVLIYNNVNEYSMKFLSNMFKEWGND